MKYMAEIGFDFFFVGNLWNNPEDLTELLRIEPTIVRHEGNTIPGRKYNISSPYSMWGYSVWDTIDEDLNKLTEMLLDKFETKVELIIEYLSKHPVVEAKLWFVIRADPENFPSLYLNKRLISFLGKINASIDFDTYIDEVYKL